MHVSLEHPARGYTQDRPEPVFVQNSVNVDDDMQISVLEAFHAMDGRRSRDIKEVLDLLSRRRCGGHLRRNELSELVDNMAAFNSLKVKIWKYETSWKIENSNQNIVTNEEFEKIIVMK